MNYAQKETFGDIKSLFGPDRRPIIKKGIEAANKLDMMPRYRIISTNEKHTRSFKIMGQDGKNLPISGKRGIYCYWCPEIDPRFPDDPERFLIKPLYVGMSAKCLRNRVTYCVASVWNDAHITESHNGANVYRMMYGTGNFKYLTYSYLELDCDERTLKYIESIVEKKFEPFYKKYKRDYEIFRTKEISKENIGLSTFFS